MRQLNNSYSRILVDCHISDTDKSFMTRFDARKYVEMVKKSGCDSAMVYACCHNGNCYYPTEIGHRHKNLNGRDIFGDTISLLSQNRILPIAYYTVCWNNSAAKNNEQWRFTDMIGRQHSGRYHFCCPNNIGYREFAKAQISEILSYDIAGIFIDMTFWPGICFCPVCRKKFRRQYNADIPTTINWFSPEWVRFQRCRENWLNEFAMELTGAIKKLSPMMSVTHQFSPVLLGWYLSLDSSFIEASDYPSGDFYGGRDQQRLGTKVFSAFTTDEPFEFMTSRCVNLYDHTSTKSSDEMLVSAATTLANGGAYLFIDAINPDGTLEDSVYDKLSAVSSRLEPFKAKLAEHRPRLHSDVGLYFSMRSNIDINLNDTPLQKVVAASSVCNMDSLVKSETMAELLGTSILLNKLHIPYTIVTDRDTNLSAYKTIIVNNAIVMSNTEVRALREFVHSGGVLIATGLTSISDSVADKTDDFLLKEIFGVSYSGRMSKKINYIFNGNEYVLCNTPAPLVDVHAAQVLACLCEPLFEQNDPENYASIHSNPPHPGSDGPAALTINRFGKGTCVYLCSNLLALQQDSQQSFGSSLLQQYLKSDLSLTTNLPECVEVTLLKSSSESSYLLCLINFQKELPNIPIKDISISLTLNSKSPSTCLKVSDGSKTNYSFNENQLTLQIESLNDIEMIEIKYQEN
jgi:hypothetical protein